MNRLGILLNRTWVIFGVFLSQVFWDILKHLEKKTESIKKYAPEFIVLIFMALVIKFFLDFIPTSDIFKRIPAWEKHLFLGLFSGFLGIYILLLLKHIGLKLYHFTDNFILEKNLINEVEIETKEILNTEEKKECEIENEKVFEQNLKIDIEQAKSTLKPGIKDFISRKQVLNICLLGFLLLICVSIILLLLAGINLYLPEMAFSEVCYWGWRFVLIIFIALAVFSGIIDRKVLLKIIEILKHLPLSKINVFRKKSSEEETKN